MNLSDACDAYLRDLEARNLRLSTRRNYKSIFRALLYYADQQGLSELVSFDQSVMRNWRESWTCKPSTQRFRLQQLKAFFTHAAQAGWISASPLLGLKPPRSQSKPTMPFSRDEFRDLIAAASTKPKERALLLLMRFSGLSIRDAVTLRRDAVDGNNLTLRRAKSGELVMLYVPDLVIVALNRIKQPGRDHFFWSGTSSPNTTTKYWRSRLHLVARDASVRDFTPHRLRHTFAVEALIAHVPIKDVSTLLGHSSVLTTERHYAQWNIARRDRLVQIARGIYECNPSLLLLDGCVPRKNITGAVAAAPVSSSADSRTKLTR